MCHRTHLTDPLVLMDLSTDLLRYIAGWVPTWCRLALSSTSRRWRVALPRHTIRDQRGMYVPMIEGAHVRLAQWIRATGCGWGPVTSSTISSTGSIEMLEWALRYHGLGLGLACPTDDQIYATALRRRQWRALHWLRVRGVPIRDANTLLHEMASSGNTSGLLWLCSLGKSYHDAAVSAPVLTTAVRHARVDVMNVILHLSVAVDCDLVNADVLEAACASGSVEVMEWAAERTGGDLNWTYSSVVVTVDSVAVMDWLEARECAPHPDCVSTCLRLGSWACLAWLFARGYIVLPGHPLAESICRRGGPEELPLIRRMGAWHDMPEHMAGAAETCNISMLDALHAEGVRILPSALTRIRHEEVLRWLHGHGYTFPDNMMECAVRETNMAMILLLRSWGWEWAPNSTVILINDDYWTTLREVVALGCPWSIGIVGLEVSAEDAEYLLTLGCPYAPRIRENRTQHVSIAELVGTTTDEYGDEYGDDDDVPELEVPAPSEYSASAWDDA